MAFELKIVLTTQARIYRSQSLITGEGCTRIDGFSVGSSGYDPLDVTVALAPDPTDNALISQVFPTTGFEPYDAVENINVFTPVFVFRLEENEAVGSLGELGVWATVIGGPDDGLVYLHAIAHFPIYNKTATDVRVFRVTLPN